jgi:hypothetical protein
MAATIYAAPKDLPVPEWSEYEVDGRFDYKRMNAVDDAYLERLRVWLREHGYTGELAGETVAWGRGDGRALYMVMKLRPLWLMHIELGDAWRMDAIFERGLTARDIRQQVEGNKRMAALFSKQEATS